MKKFLEPQGLFEGTVVKALFDNDEDENDKLTFCIIYDDGTEEQWSEYDVIQGMAMLTLVNDLNQNQLMMMHAAPQAQIEP